MYHFEFIEEEDLNRQIFPPGLPQGTGFPGFPGAGGGPVFPGPGSFPGMGGFPGGGQSTEGQPPAPSQQILSKFQQLNQNPSQAQGLLLSQGGATTFGVGCNRRWTIILLKNGQIFLMFVLSANPFGSTTGWIWPGFSFASFPSSRIAAYSC